jgi:alpha-1,3-rhamnosyl/mannosyltransferase
MKVGLSVSVLDPAYNNGRPDGMSVCTRQLLSGLSRLGHQVEQYSFSGGGDATPVQQRFPHSFAAMAGLGIATGGRNRFAAPVDIFHVTDYHVVPMRCPVVATLYDAIPMVFPEMASPRFRRFKNFVLRQAAGFADHVIAISHYSVAELVEHFKVPESKISVVHCGVGSEWLSPLPESVWQETLLRRGLRSGYYLFVGILQPRKNLERVIQAHDSLPAELRRERPLVVVGKAGWHCEALLEKLARKEALGEARWLNDVHAFAELRHLYAGAGVFIFPSLYEGFGLPVLEAFASGLPVVTSSTTSLPEVSGGVAFEVDPTSVEGIAEAMQNGLIESERDWRIPAGRERAALMNWDACVDGTLAVYRKVLGEGIA